MTDLFAFDDVRVTIDGSTVLDGITVRLPSNRLTVVAGASGSGKTSLLRLCNRLDVPTGGGIRFHGDDLLVMDPLRLRKKVGMVFQRPALFGGTVRDNLLAARPRATESEMANSLSGVELAPEFLDRIGDDLSGGEAQRACLARALLCSPDVLLMDEPTAALHPAARRALEATVQTLQRAGLVDIVWVTHDLDQIERMAEYLVVLQSGRVLYSGMPDSAEAGEALATLTDVEET
jgi:UDP-glucose/iron transport system ATP-binding protein